MEKISKYVFILIEKHRKDNNITLEKVSLLSGVSFRHYMDLKNGKHTPRLDTIYEMCERLGLRLSELIIKAEELKVIYTKKEVA